MCIIVESCSEMFVFLVQLLITQQQLICSENMSNVLENYISDTMKRMLAVLDELISADIAEAIKVKTVTKCLLNFKTLVSNECLLLMYISFIYRHMLF